MSQITHNEAIVADPHASIPEIPSWYHPELDDIAYVWSGIHDPTSGSLGHPFSFASIASSQPGQSSTLGGDDQLLDVSLGIDAPQEYQPWEVFQPRMSGLYHHVLTPQLDASEIMQPVIRGASQPCRPDRQEEFEPETRNSAEIDIPAAAQPDINEIIGTLSINGDIKCTHKRCARSFGRFAELRRHHDSKHATLKPEFWCDQPLCERSLTGGRPFHRKDKLRDHRRKVHH
ncbi:hypothetical protein NX059_002325 [Plenodomus lindquistii]|nr:hypothetical protein NX059_002325 [Plenodomus lindquistii]